MSLGDGYLRDRYGDTTKKYRFNECPSCRGCKAIHKYNCFLRRSDFFSSPPQGQEFALKIAVIAVIVES